MTWNLLFTIGNARHLSNVRHWVQNVEGKHVSDAHIVVACGQRGTRAGPSFSRLTSGTEPVSVRYLQA